MPRFTLPDGKILEVPEGTSYAEVVGRIGPRLAKDALAVIVDGEVRDLMRPVDREGALRVLTADDPEGLDVLRHSTAHVMAAAVLRLFPRVDLDIGPCIRDGYYYDFGVETPFTPDDLGRIETEMQRLVDEDKPFVRTVVMRDEGERLLTEMGQKYKISRLHDIAEETPVSFYRCGDFVDLCAGPHVPSTGRLRAFRLLSVAGSYWRGSETNPMLQRIYGTAFKDRKALDGYLRQREEAARRDHRKLGKELGLFSFHEEGPGFPFWLPKGTTIYQAIMVYMRRKLVARGYVEVMCPLILDESLWHRSGHWDNYAANMYFTEIDERRYAVKPMNCPGHILTYCETPHSYRELPLRIAEFGQVHRHELSGVLHGLFRVRTFTQDDAHHFCTPDQVEAEVGAIIDLTREVYRDFGFADVRVAVSTRPEKAIGSEEAWARATAALEHALGARRIEYEVKPGEGAFYGPKIEFLIQDCLGRTWQCGTVQVDFAMPERFDLAYTGPDDKPHRPVMVHRAILGSLERFIGVLIEHHGGAFPTWLAPVQAVVIPVTDAHRAYAEAVRDALLGAGVRAEADVRNEKIGYKIRGLTMLKVPVLAVVGDREVAEGTVSVRLYRGGDRGAVDRAGFLDAMRRGVEPGAEEPFAGDDVTGGGDAGT